MQYQFTIHYPKQQIIHSNAYLESLAWPAFILQDLYRMFGSLHFSASNYQSERSGNASVVYHWGQTLLAVDQSTQDVFYKPRHESVQSRSLMEETSACLKQCHHLDPLVYWEVIEDLQGNLIKGYLIVASINNHTPVMTNLNVLTCENTHLLTHSCAFFSSNHRLFDADSRNRASSQHLDNFLRESSHVRQLIINDEGNATNPPSSSSPKCTPEPCAQKTTFCSHLLGEILRLLLIIYARTIRFLRYLIRLARDYGTVIGTTITRQLKFSTISVIASVFIQYFSQLHAQYKYCFYCKECVCQAISHLTSPRKDPAYQRPGFKTAQARQHSEDGLQSLPTSSFSIF